MIGQTISHYRILEKLGEGGMGVVYKSEDTKLRRLVALKFLPSGFTSDPDAKKRFLYEAQAASALQHSNICTVHDIDETPDGQLFIVLDLYEGETLKEIIKRGPLKVDEAIEITLQIAQGLSKAHEKGIVHRDIKPANVLITTDGVAKILDFGLAKLGGVSKLTKPSSTVGTAAYMSPEQARGDAVDHRTDLWSLGCALYEMITGQTPFKGEYEQAMTYQIINTPAEPVTALRSGVPMDLERIVKKCMEKDPRERYQTAADLAADLRHIQRTTGAHAPQVRGTVKTSPRGQKRLYLILAALLAITIGLVLIFKPFSPGPVKNMKSIAILPFKNLSSSKEDEYFSDGIAEDIRTQLSNIADLKVISQQGVLRYKHSDKSITEIGKELGVATVLEGSVQHAGNQVRINAQLIDASNESHMWAETYDKEMTQIFAIQSDVAQQIASVLKAKLLLAEKARIQKTPTENTEAYQLYLKGRFYWNKRRAEDLEKAMEFFQQAIQKDTNYALAYAGLASAYIIYPEYSGKSANEYGPKAEDAANKAVILDRTLSEAHAVLAMFKEQFEYDWEGGEREYERAIEMNPNNATAHHWYRVFLCSQGRFDEGLAEIERALVLDPLSLIINRNLAAQYYLMRQYDKAVEQSKKTIELDPNFPGAYITLGYVLVQQGKFDEAVAEFRKVGVLARNDPVGISGLGYTYARSGRRTEALQCLQQLLELSKQGYSLSAQIAMVYSALGEKDKTFEWLTRAYEERNRWMVDLKVDPVWDSLRSDPRYHELLKRIGLEK